MTAPCGCICSPRPELLNCTWPAPPSITPGNCPFGVGGLKSTAFPMFAPTRWSISTVPGGPPLSGVILESVDGEETDVWESDSFTSGSRTWYWRLEITGTAAADFTLKKIYTAHPDGDFPGEITFTAIHDFGTEYVGAQYVCVDRNDPSVLKWFQTDFLCCYIVGPYDSWETTPIPGTFHNRASLKVRSMDTPTVYNYHDCGPDPYSYNAPYTHHNSGWMGSIGVLAMGFKIAINCTTGLLDLYEKPNGTGGGFAGTRLAVSGLSLDLPTPITWLGLPNGYGVSREFTILSFWTA